MPIIMSDKKPTLGSKCFHFFLKIDFKSYKRNNGDNTSFEMNCIRINQNRIKLARVFE